MRHPRLIAKTPLEGWFPNLWAEVLISLWRHLADHPTYALEAILEPEGLERRGCLSFHATNLLPFEQITSAIKYFLLFLNLVCWVPVEHIEATGVLNPWQSEVGSDTLLPTVINYL